MPDFEGKMEANLRCRRSPGTKERIMGGNHVQRIQNEWDIEASKITSQVYNCTAFKNYLSAPMIDLKESLVYQQCIISSSGMYKQCIRNVQNKQG